MTTFANKLRSVLPSVVESSTEATQEPPAPLNKEALQVILDYAEEKALQGFGGVMFFLDGIYEQYFSLEHTNRFYHESTVLDMLKGSELGFKVEEEDAGDGTYVKLWWSESHPFFTTSSVKTIEVTPPEEVVGYLESITCL